jgi:transcriptional regulator with PAS, ATPase and Fis domain
MTKRGEFREDLYWRLNVVPIFLPPLRERREDVPLLIEHFLGRFSSLAGREVPLSQEAMRLLLRYPWPGNIRELENIMARMAVVCDSQVIEESDLPYDFALGAGGAAAPAENDAQSLEAAILAFEKSFLRKALKKNAWNRKRTAEQLQIGYSTLKAKLKAYGIVAGADGDDE